MSEFSDPAVTIERLERRLAREKSARLQAEAFAERLAADRWDIRQELEEKLALRTSELEIARHTASQAITDRDRLLDNVFHELRTALTALFFLTDSFSSDRPPAAEQIAELRDRLDGMRIFMDGQGNALPTLRSNIDPARRSEETLAEAVAVNEAGWHQLAARSGKLLLLDVETHASRLSGGTAEEVDRLVRDALHDRLDSLEPIIELHLQVGTGGLECR